MNYYEDRLKTINFLLESGYSTIAPNEVKRLKQERDEILKYLNGEPVNNL